jgi:hypothetical protein
VVSALLHSEAERQQFICCCRWFQVGSDCGDLVQPEVPGADSPIRRSRR